MIKYLILLLCCHSAVAQTTSLTRLPQPIVWNGDSLVTITPKQFDVLVVDIFPEVAKLRKVVPNLEGTIEHLDRSMEEMKLANDDLQSQIIQLKAASLKCDTMLIDHQALETNLKKQSNRKIIGAVVGTVTGIAGGYLVGRIQ